MIPFKLKKKKRERELQKKCAEYQRFSQKNFQATRKRKNFL